MEFCSKYAYDYGFSGSDSDSLSDEDNNTASSKKVEKKFKKVRKADANIIAVKFDQLILTSEMFAGDPIKCKKCEAIMTETSKPIITDEKKTWNCEYCYEENDISFLDSLDQIPKLSDVTYLIEPAPQKNDDSNASNASNFLSSDNNYLVYCVDISGSMDTNIPIKPTDDQTNQTMNPTIKEISRLDGVKVACAESIKNLKTQEPNKRVGLVTFSNNVKYFGDGSKIKNNNPLINIGEPYRYRTDNNNNTDDLMQNKEKLIAVAQNQDGNLKPISESNTFLEQKIKTLRTEGSTALGPALTFSIGFTSRQPGSQVILCTDGCANIGMGSVESHIGDAQNQAEKFYEEIAEYAKTKGVTVNIVSMEGTDCKLALLGKVADKTNGTMNIVNPLNLSEEFKSILENKIVATEVKAKLIVNNKYLYIRDDDFEVAESKAYESNDPNAKLELDKIKKSTIIKDVGNANIDTEITFEYGVRRLNKDEKKEAVPLKELPFQLQISYVLPDGAKALRVYSKIQEFTKDRNKVERNLQQDMLYSNYAQKMSNHVSNSNVTTAQYRSHQIQRLQQQNQYRAPDLFQQNIHAITTMASNQRYEEMNDAEANMIYHGKKMNRKHFKK